MDSLSQQPTSAESKTTDKTKTTDTTTATDKKKNNNNTTTNINKDTMTVAPTNYYTPRRYPATHFESTPAGESIPVVIVGAGPVGLGTALGLAQRGVQVTLIDKGLGASYGSRATCYSRHTLEIAHRLGYGELLASRALGWVGGRSYYHDQEVLYFEMPNEAHSIREPMFNIGQCEYEDIQLTAVDKAKNIRCLWGVTLTDVAVDDTGVTLSVEGVDGARTLRADRVVASDGGRSTVREKLGLRLEGTAYEGRYVIADIHWKTPMTIERKVWFDPPSNPGSTVIMHKQPDDIWRIDYQLVDGEDAAYESTPEAITARITKHLAWLENNGTITKLPWTLQWHSFYKALALALPSFVHGKDNRVVFAGDAAHLVPIFGVRGANSGMEDADTLAWMLAAVANGDADPSLLQAYSDERHDAWEQNIRSAGKSTLIMTPGTEGYRMTRNGLLQVARALPEFNHLINPRQSSACHALRSPLTVPIADVQGLRPGEPLEDRRITLDGKQTSLDTARGAGFGVYALAPYDESAVASVVDTLRKALPHERVTLIPLAEGADGGAAQAWSASQGEVVVVRPDGIVLTRGTPKSLPDLKALLTGTPNDRSATDPVHLTAKQLAREMVWTKLSEALDAADDKQELLVRLALVLGADAGPERFTEVLKKIA